jgi:hypothetical protein
MVQAAELSVKTHIKEVGQPTVSAVIGVPHTRVVGSMECCFPRIYLRDILTINYVFASALIGFHKFLLLLKLYLKNFKAS